jgi:hypothetical protein
VLVALGAASAARALEPPLAGTPAGDVAGQVQSTVEAVVEAAAPVVPVTPAVPAPDLPAATALPPPAAAAPSSATGAVSATIAPRGRSAAGPMPAGSRRPGTSAAPAQVSPERRRAARRERKRDRRLRRAVLTRRGCLGALPRLARRVLVLRAGVGRPKPRSRRTVARILDRRVSRIRRVERRALRQLRNLAEGGCGASSPAAVTTAGAGGGLVLPAGFGPAARQQVGGLQEAGRDRRRRSIPAANVPDSLPAAAIPPLSGGDGDTGRFLSIALILAILAIGSTAFRRNWPGFR